MEKQLLPPPPPGAPGVQSTRLSSSAAFMNAARGPGAELAPLTDTLSHFVGTQGPKVRNNHFHSANEETETPGSKAPGSWASVKYTLWPSDSVLHEQHQTPFRPRAATRLERLPDLSPLTAASGRTSLPPGLEPSMPLVPGGSCSSYFLNSLRAVRQFSSVAFILLACLQRWGHHYSLS